MKNFVIFILLTIGLIVGCSKEKEPEISCIDSVLEEHGMIEYTDQEIGCSFFLELYHYKNKEYFLLGSHCADVAGDPVDCEGNGLCGEDGSAFQCERFDDNAELIRIVGIQEQE